MKKLLISISLFAMSSLVNAASQRTELTLVWQVDAVGHVRVPISVALKSLMFYNFEASGFYTTDQTCDFYPVGNSPIRIAFEKDASIKHLSGRIVDIAVPRSYASWDALPDATKIIIGYCCKQRELKATLKLPDISLQISEPDLMQETMDRIHQSRKEMEDAAAMVARAPLAATMSAVQAFDSLRDSFAIYTTPPLAQLPLAMQAALKDDGE